MWLTPSIARRIKKAGPPLTLPINTKQILKGDEITARKIMASAPNGDLIKLKQPQLQAICKGLGLNLSGSKVDVTNNPYSMMSVLRAL